MCTRRVKSSHGSRHSITAFQPLFDFSLTSLLPLQSRRERAVENMEISQTRFVGPPTPQEPRENVTMATLPDLFVTFIAPEPKVNPHYDEVKREAEEWMRENLWKELSEKEIKKRCAADFCYFGAIMCPDIGKEEFRTVCDWIFWVSHEEFPSIWTCC